MLQKEKPNAVAIAVIPSHQYEIAKYALENGMAVFAEKPLTTSFDTSQKLYKLAKKKRLPNMIDFLFPEIPAWHEAKQAIENKLVGKILNINVDWTFLSYDLKNRIKSWKTYVEEGGGVLSFYFSHTFYYLEYFLGRIKNLQCNFSSSKQFMNYGETAINMTFLFENGCRGNAHMDISDSSQQKHIVEFHGEEGIITLQNVSNDFVDNFELIVNTKNVTQKIKPHKILSLSHEEFEDPRVKIIQPLAERFIKWCSTGIAAKPDFEDGLRVQELIEMARSSNSNSHK
jgi:predicted dehydrogenase